MKDLRIRLTFLEPMLGTVPKDKQVYSTYIASKAEPEISEGEVETVPVSEEKNWTGFHEDDGPFIYNYMIKGHFKAQCSALRKSSKSASSKLSAHLKVINQLVFIFPRKIYLNLNGGELGVLERPLRAATAKGERITVTRSDTCPAGSSIEFDVKLFDGGATKKQVFEWLDHGQFYGLGQWRNAGYGSYSYEVL
jgi:hypothetical protein